LSKNDKTIEEIHAKIDIQNSVLLGLVQDSMKSLSMQKEVKQREDKIGESAKELEEEEQRYEALYQMQRQLNNPTSILSVGKKVGERSQHG